MRRATKECPCRSGRSYDQCCRPLHDGAQQAGTPEELMRSRFSAFALGLGDYLADTLSLGHDDRRIPRDVLVRELSRAKDRQRFLDLSIRYAEDDEVLFVARVFERGQDRSFAELSTFVREDGRWRYASGILVPRKALPSDLAEITRDRFLEAAGVV